VNKPLEEQSTSLGDVKQLGLFAAIASLSYVFWIVGAMEMVERLAYYGVKAVAALYATDPVSKGGLGVTPGEFGLLLMLWALVQSILPVFTGGLSDRFGYKRTIFVSTVIKIGGYLTMAALHTYWGFYLGAVILASGTAIFKPGIQGTLVKATDRTNSSMAWGIFYQTVNIGGFLGPIVAARMRSEFSSTMNPGHGWTMVFIVCALIISFNFLLLLTYREVGKEERLKRLRLQREGKLKQKNLLFDSLGELCKPHVFIYLLIFSGFWFMFNALFDVLPLHIRDWVDRSDIMQSLFATGETRNSFMKFLLGMNADGTDINPEGMLNLNAGLIMITCFFFAYISGLMRATTSMVVGTMLATLALFAIGHATTGWIMVMTILLFSVGEMLSSPKFSEYIGNFAPHDKKAMYLGFSQIPLAVGWTLEGFLGPWLYGIYASKDQFSRDLIVSRLQSDTAALPTGESLAALATESTLTAEQIANLGGQGTEKLVAAIPQGEAFDWLVSMTGEAPRALTDVLYQTHSIATVWYIMGAVGIVSALGIALYGKWVLTLSEEETER
jgi:proton-dependent oligopeptide transporter, POT family